MQLQNIITQRKDVLDGDGYNGSNGDDDNNDGDDDDE